MPGTNLLVLFGLVFYLGASLLLWNLLLKEPPRVTPRPERRAHPPRWPIRLAKAMGTVLGGAASGGVSLLLIATVVNAGKPGTMTPPVKWAVWGAATVLAILFVGRAPLIRRVITRSCLVVGLQAMLLPLATLLSFVVAGARLAGSAGTGGERALDYLGLRLAGHLPVEGESDQEEEDVRHEQHRLDDRLAVAVALAVGGVEHPLAQAVVEREQAAARHVGILVAGVGHGAVENSKLEARRRGAPTASTTSSPRSVTR